MSRSFFFKSSVQVEIVLWAKKERDEKVTKYEITFHRGHKDRSYVEKKVEIIEADDSGEAMEIAFERVEGTSWRIDKIEEVK